MGTIADLTPAKCLELCDAAGHLFFAVQFSSECFCSDTQPGAFGPASAPCVNCASTDRSFACDMPCAGDAGEICGGSNANAVYEIARAAPEPAPEPATDDCTPATGDPYSNGGVRLACCAGSVSCLKDWDGDDRWYFLCLEGATCPAGSTPEDEVDVAQPEPEPEPEPEPSPEPATRSELGCFADKYVSCGDLTVETRD